MNYLYTALLKSLRKPKFFLGLFFIYLFLINGCSSSKECMQKEMKGTSAVVGNEPFARQAIITEKNEVFLIKASDEIKKLLLNNQGHYFEIKYTPEKDSAGLHIINVIKAEKL